MSTYYGSFIIVASWIIQAVLICLGIYALVLLIKALKIYIGKNGNI